MNDFQVELAANIFCGLVGSSAWTTYREVDEVRSAAYTDTVDVKLDGQWYRVSSTPIDEPISVAEHNGEAES